MEQRFARPALAAVAMATLLGTVALPASGDAMKPGTVLTVAGTGKAGFSGDNGPATQAQLHTPGGLAFDAAGNLYITDGFNHRVRRVSPDGTITTVAGTGKPGFSGDGGKATDAQLNSPYFLAVDGAGALFISDRNNHRVRKVTPDGIISTYAGSGPVESATDPTTVPHQGGFAGDNGPAADARLYAPTGLAVDTHGNLFIADTYNKRVRKVSSEGIITTVVGTGANVFSGDGGLATEAGSVPYGGVAVDSGGNLYFAENPTDFGRSTYRVRKVGPDGIITSVAGSGSKGGFSGDGGPATGAVLDHPWGLVVDSLGNLFVSDWGNYRVREIDAATGTITTVAGIGRKPYAGDGRPATETGLRGPLGVTVDAAGNLLIADTEFEHESDGLPADERVLKVVGVAAPGLLAGMSFPR
jgi:sugar lactone lactonase YvrE